MPRWLLLLLVFTCVACAIWWYVSRPEPLPQGPPILVGRRTEDVEGVAPQTVERRQPQRELAISGRLFCEGPRSYRVRLGEEETVPDAGGAFSFEAAVRSRFSEVELWRGGELVARERVLTGDPAEGDPIEDRGLARFPERPARIRWSWNVLPQKPDSSSLSIDFALAEEWGRGGRVLLRGRTALPDGASLTGTLYFERLRFIASLDPANAQNGGFSVEVYCPLDMVFYAGEYRAQVVFNTLLQKIQFRVENSELQTMIENGELLAERAICVGEPAQARSEDLVAQRYYIRLLDEAQRAEDVLRARIEELKIAAMDWDPGLLRVGEAARTGWFHESMMDEEGRFVVDRWRRFLDQEWRPRVRLLLEEHGARGQEKYMEAADHMGRVLRALHDLSFMYSKFRVYPLFSLPPAPEDWYEDAYEGGDISLAERTLRQSTEELQRYRRLVDNVVQSASRCGALR